MNYSKKSVKKHLFILIFFISNIASGSIVYPVTISGTGNTIQTLDFEEKAKGESNFSYSHGLTGTQRGAPESIKTMYIPDSKYKHWGDVADLGDKFVYFNPYSKRYEVFRFSSVSTHLYQAFPINGGDNSDWKFLEALGSNTSNNLLKNNNAQKGLKYWDIIQNGGEGFASGFYNNSVNKGFNTSYSWNIKEQTIDMSKFGILTDKDKVMVSVEFKDTYCSNDYLLLEVELKDKNHNIIKRFSTGKRPTKTPKLCKWAEDRLVEEVFETINIPVGKTVHYITYRDGGRDVESWAGRYGVVISNAKVAVVRN